MRFLVVAAALSAACGGQSSQDGAGGAAGGGSGGGGGSVAGSGGGGTGGGTAGTGGATSGGGGGGGDACSDPKLKSCQAPGECVLTTNDCCLCGMPELESFVAMNQQHAGACSCAGPICDCASATNPNLAASCEGGTCVAWDVRKRDDYAACKVDADCRLRAGLDCCEPCLGSPELLVAVRTDSESKLKAAFCAPDAACSKCMVQYPPDAKAVCSAGHCQVLFGP